MYSSLKKGSPRIVCATIVLSVLCLMTPLVSRAQTSESTVTVATHYNLTPERRAEVLETLAYILERLQLLAAALQENQSAPANPDRDPAAVSLLDREYDELEITISLDDGQARADIHFLEGDDETFYLDAPFLDQQAVIAEIVELTGLFQNDVTEVIVFAGGEGAERLVDEDTAEDAFARAEDLFADAEEAIRGEDSGATAVLGLISALADAESSLAAAEAALENGQFSTAFSESITVQQSAQFIIDIISENI